MSDVPSRPLRVVAVSGSPTQPSRTTALVVEVAERLARGVEGEVTLVELAPLLGELGQGVFRPQIGAAAQAALDTVEAADVLVVGSPAYRATYTGLFKLFFDHVGQYALVDKPVILTATGGSDRHALLVEHQMRPLFGFFQAHTLPLGIYAGEADFSDYQVASEELSSRIDLSIRRALPLIAATTTPGALEFARPDVF
jgi:FMN reductase